MVGKASHNVPVYQMENTAIGLFYLLYTHLIDCESRNDVWLFMDYSCLATRVSQICFYLHLKYKAQLNANFSAISRFTESTEANQCNVWNSSFSLNFNSNIACNNYAKPVLCNNITSHCRVKITTATKCNLSHKPQYYAHSQVFQGC